MDVPAFLEGEGDPAEVEGAGPAIHAPFSVEHDGLGMEECIEPVDVGAVEAELESLLAPPPPAALPTTSSPTAQATPPSFHHTATAARPFSPLVRIYLYLFVFVFYLFIIFIIFICAWQEWVLPFFAGEARTKRRAALVACFTPRYVGWREARDVVDADHDEGAAQERDACADAPAASGGGARHDATFSHERRLSSFVLDRHVVAPLALVCAAAAWLYASQGNWLAVAFAVFAALVGLNALALHTVRTGVQRVSRRTPAIHAIDVDVGRIAGGVARGANAPSQPPHASADRAA
jgi:hypothetical protein